MDFSSQLVNLQKKAAAATSQPQQQPPGASYRGGESYDRRHRKRQRHHGPPGRRPHHRNDHGLERALASLPQFRIPRPTPAAEQPDKSVRHIALLVLSIDDLPYEHLWKEWASSQDSGDSTTLYVSVICHAKFPKKIKSDWLRQRLLVDPPKMGRGNEFDVPIYHTRRPEWGSIEITRAMLDLLHEGLQIGTHKNPQDDKAEGDFRFSQRRYNVSNNTKKEILNSEPLPRVDKFIFVSETCIPVTTLKETTAALFGENQEHVSWVNARSTPNNGYSKQLQFDKMHPAIPSGCRWKADQWMVFSRAHAVAVMEIDRSLPRHFSLWECFRETKASDELYFPSALGLLGQLPAGDKALVKLQRVTYADWSVSAKNPATFSKGVLDLKKVAALARKEGCLMARKFSPSAEASDQETVPEGNISVDEWKLVIKDLASSDKTEQQPEQVETSTD